MADYFGTAWPSGICDDGDQVPTPIGETCLLCEEPIQGGDRGTFMYGPELNFEVMPGLVLDGAVKRQPVHRECSLRSVLGGIGHHLDHDFWCSVRHDPDGGRTYHESALLVWALVQHRAGLADRAFWQSQPQSDG